MRGPMDMAFGVFSETYVRLLTSITSQFFSKYSKSYNSLNVKSCLKLNGLYQKDGLRWCCQIICTLCNFISALYNGLDKL